MTLPPGLHIFLAFFSFCFGAIMGSFANVCIWRLPREESLVRPKSHCPKCQTPIAWHDNIPVVSFLRLGGRCRHCKELISLKYPLVELLIGLIFVGMYWRYGLTLTALIYAFVAMALVVITFIDLDHFIIPNEITYGGILAGLLLAIALTFLRSDQFLVNHITDALIGGAAGAGTILAIDLLSRIGFKKPGMGGGDVKLMGMIGTFVGWKLTIVNLMGAACIGAVVGIALLLTGRISRQDDLPEGNYIPFGPYLALGALIILFAGKEIRSFMDEHFFDVWKIYSEGTLGP